MPPRIPSTTPRSSRSRQWAVHHCGPDSCLNIKAKGPTIYAHEIYVLNGAAPGETYTVTNNF